MGLGQREASAPLLRPFEIACGVPLGLDESPPLEREGSPKVPLLALESVLLHALLRPPCLFSFSGGRDSSALLAAAAQVAKREGLDPPVPATLVFPGSDDADEDDWQSRVLHHLGLVDWERINIRGELDAVGPVAARELDRHGLLWPFNTHFHLPIIERAAGGSVVTGFGGDEIGNSTAYAKAERILADRHVSGLPDLLVVGLAVSPRPLRSAVHRRRPLTGLGEQPWLTEEGRRQVARAYGSHLGAVPLGWEAKVRRWIWPGRFFRICQASLQRLASDHDVAMVHPFVDGSFLDALGQFGGFRGLGSRTDFLREVFGDLLPTAVIERSTKGGFTDPLWTERAREFAKDWSGRGVDEELVNVDELRRHWRTDDRNLLSTTLLQVAWLHDNS